MASVKVHQLVHASNEDNNTGVQAAEFAESTGEASLHAASHAKYSRKLHICAVADPYRYLETKISLVCGGQNFSAKGREVIAEGWKLYDGKKGKEKESEEDAENNVLPSLLENMQMVLSDAVIKEGKTSPPKHFTEDTLLSSMETAGDVPDEAERQGIGTPATRAGIIEKLVQKGYIERQGDKKSKHLVSTHKGNALITVIPEQIQSPSMTADWEEKLLQVESGQYEGTAFMDEITHKYSGFVTGLTQNVEELLKSDTARLMLANSEFLILLNQATTDRDELAALLNISDNQLSYITNVGAGHGLIRCSGNLVPFENSFPRNTKLYRLMTTKPGEA